MASRRGGDPRTSSAGDVGWTSQGEPRIERAAGAALPRTGLTRSGVPDVADIAPGLRLRSEALRLLAARRHSVTISSSAAILLVERHGSLQTALAALIRDVAGSNKYPSVGLGRGIERPDRSSRADQLPLPSTAPLDTKTAGPATPKSWFTVPAWIAAIWQRRREAR